MNKLEIVKKIYECVDVDNTRITESVGENLELSVDLIR